MYVSLRSGSRIRSLYREGTRRSVGGVIVYRNPGAIGEPEAGFVAGKKVGNAVERNRAKRRLREAARRIELAPATAHVFVASRDVITAPFDTLVDWMQAGAGVGPGARADDE